jgi:hypothetical protein
MGKLLAFSLITNTQMIAKIGDPNEDIPAYELWFSFTSPENKQRFLDLVRQDGYADPDEPTTLKEPPVLEDLPHLRPLSYVFPKHIVEHITNIALMVQMSIGVPGQESN